MIVWHFCGIYIFLGIFRQVIECLHYAVRKFWISKFGVGVARHIEFYSIFFDAILLAKALIEIVRIAIGWNVGIAWNTQIIKDEIREQPILRFF